MLGLLGIECAAYLDQLLLLDQTRFPGGDLTVSALLWTESTELLAIESKQNESVRGHSSVFVCGRWSARTYFFGAAGLDFLRVPWAMFENWRTVIGIYLGRAGGRASVRLDFTTVSQSWGCFAALQNNFIGTGKH